MKLHEIALMGLRICAWLISILVIWWLILKLTGHSPTTDQITLAFASGIMIYVVRINGKLERLMGEFKMYRKESDRRFFALAKDFKKHLESHD